MRSTHLKNIHRKAKSVMAYGIAGVYASSSSKFTASNNVFLV